MAISVVEPVSAAFERMKLILFQPFDIGKWFVLGFCAWLAQLGEGGGGGFNGGGGPHEDKGSGPQFQSMFDSAREWFFAYLAIILVVGLIVLVVVVALTLLVLWLQSRGKFMFIDGVVRNRAAVVEPWRRFRVQGNSLFWFQVVMGLVGLLALAVSAAVGLALAWTDIAASHFGAGAIIGLIVGIGLFAMVCVVLALVGFVIENFVTPAMYLHGVKILPAWRLFLREILPGHAGTLFLFLLMKVLLEVAVGIATFALMCCTCCVCCLGALPYIGTVILLPVYVFLRCYSLCFLDQFGDRWRFFPSAAAPAAPPAPGAA